MDSTSKISVFISYSWDSKEHQQWVINLADTISNHGGNAIVDRTHLKYGNHIKTFMIKSIIEVDIVLLILTPNYKKKADSLQGGAGYEYNIINDELFKVITTNDKFIPIIREGDIETSVTNFLKGFNCLDLKDGENYNQNLQELISQILKKDNDGGSINNLKTLSMDEEYKNINSIIYEVKVKSFEYFKKLFVGDNLDETKRKLGKLKQEWTDNITTYHSTFEADFSPKKMKLYEKYLEDFRGNVFAKKLWTVAAALKTRDPDLARYKKDYREANAALIYKTVNDILQAAHSYKLDVASRVDYNNLKTVEELEMEFLNEENMVMKKVVGFGIRSEILHRYHPDLFPIMTQPNLWAMYYISESNIEFITIETNKKEKKIRVSHNWQYPYDRFAFLMNVISIELYSWFKMYDVQLSAELRFGYVNMFLSKISDSHKTDTKLLHEWIDAN